MKKCLVVLLATLMLLTMTGCAADGEATISNADEAVLTVNGTDYTRADFYRALVSSDAEALVLNKLTKMIYASEINEDDSEILTEAEDQVNLFKEYYGDLAETYIYYYYGYSSIEAYQEDLANSLKLEALATKYTEENKDTLIAANSPRKIQMITFTTEDDAKAALSELQAGKTMDEVATEYSLTVSSKTVSECTDDLPEALYDVLSVTTEAGLDSTIYGDEEDGEFTIVYFTDCDAANFSTDELVTLFINDSIIDENVILSYFAVKGNFTLYDEDIYNDFASDYPEYLGE